MKTKANTMHGKVIQQLLLLITLLFPLHAISMDPGSSPEMTECLQTFFCSLCNKDVKDLTLLLHLNNSHIICDICNAEFDCPANLHNHFAITHATRELPVFITSHNLPTENSTQANPSDTVVVKTLLKKKTKKRLKRLNKKSAALKKE